MAGNAKLKHVVKGNTSRTMLHAAVANEVIDTCNAFRAIEFQPNGMATLELGKDTGKLVFQYRDVTICVDGQPKTFRAIGFLLNP